MKVRNFFLFLIFTILSTACSNKTDTNNTPTGFAKNEIDQPQIMYEEKIYYYWATDFDKELPEHYAKVGEVESVDNENPPLKNLSASRVEVGQEIFFNSEAENILYVKYETGYAEFSPHETAQTAETDSRVQNSFISVDMAGKKVEIPQNHILSICKNTYANEEKVHEKDIINIICNDINNSEIVQISIDSQELINMEGLKNFIKYPILFETNFDSEYMSVELLAQNGSD